MVRRALVLSLFFTSLALAQEDADAGTGVLTKPPTLTQQIEPVFPPELIDAGVSGVVTLEVDIGPDGKVLEARVAKSAGEAFDASALAAARQFVFTPAEIDGVPAAVRISFSLEFLYRPQVVETVAIDAGVKVNFRGVVVERGTRDPVEGAQVVVQGLETVTGEGGQFEFSDVPEGTFPVVVVNGDYERYEVTETFAPGKRTEVKYFIRKKLYGAYETVVRAPKERKEVAQVTLSQEEIKLIPGTNGDAFRVVQNLPGVARAPFGIGLLVVRGGKSWDTRTYVDEAPVPQLFHFGGLFSTYNAGLLENINFQAGNFNADYGRNIGGLVSAESRTPSKKGFHGYVDVNLVDASGILQGPINENWSFSVSARRSYIDVILPAVLSLIPGAEDAVSFTLAPRYYDYQARLEYRPKSGKVRFFVSFFGSSDELVLALPNPSLDPEGRGTFGTSILYNRLLFGLDLKLAEGFDFRTRTSLGLDALRFSLGDDIFAQGRQYPVRSRNTFTWAIPQIRAELSFGLDLGVQPYSVEVQSPPLPKLNQVPDPFQSKSLIYTNEFVTAVEPGLFAQLLWKPLDSLRVIGGARVDYNSQMNKAWADPRLAVFWQVHERVALKGAAGIYHQTPDYRGGLLTRGYGNPNLEAEGANQFMLGGEARFTDALSLDVQLYYKDLFNQARATLGETGGQLDLDAVDLRYTSVGRGRSYGAEILLRHALTKNFFGWIAYSLSRVERDFFGGTVFGLSQYDQPHNLIVVASYKLPYDFIVGAKLRYTSGPLTRPINAAIYDANGNYFFPIQSQQYSRRLPDFFQLDLRIDKRFVFRDFMFAIYLDVQNVTYQRNVEAVMNSYDYSEQAYLTGLPILPVLGLRAEF
ncbi:MAG: TonB-dependent receptor [Archangium sp.]|nr:TonB-dependent receptor [Archangium sp.]